MWREVCKSFKINVFLGLGQVHFNDISISKYLISLQAVLVGVESSLTHLYYGTLLDSTTWYALLYLLYSGYL